MKMAKEKHGEPTERSDMKGNGIERDTLDGVITALERVDDTWQNARNGLQYADLRDAIYYLKKYQKMVSMPLTTRLIDVLREVRGEK